MRDIAGIRVKQWPEGWNRVQFSKERFQREPEHEFYLASIPASLLKTFGMAHQRDASQPGPREDVTAIQRGLEQGRTDEIARYIRDGYPLSSINRDRLEPGQEASLRKPGWLPTAIIANLMRPGETRGNSVLHGDDALQVVKESDDSPFVRVSLPKSWTAEHDSREKQWAPAGALPIEIIDGQHRLSAFDADDDFELPVVIFNGLDISWQAYLFWTVNIKPKRINASLAYDLYPLLRHQDWLEQGETLNVYRETRAQELVESLWSDVRSVWRDRINMLGQPGMKGQRPVTQSAFIRSLTATFVRTFVGYREFGGLFGSAPTTPGLEWPRGQQAAFLVRAWGELGAAVSSSEDEWARSLRDDEVDSLRATVSPADDPAFAGPESLLASDVGVRGFHMVVNDLCYRGMDALGLRDWQVQKELRTTPEGQFNESWASLDAEPVGRFLAALGRQLASFDWRNAKAQSLTEEEREARLALRGSGGYPTLRDRLFRHLMAGSDPLIADLAEECLEARRAKADANG